MDVMAGSDDIDRYSLPPLGNTFSGSIRGSLKGTKVAWSPDLGYATVDPEVLDPEDPAMLQDLLVAAVNEAGRKVDEELQQKLGGLAGGLGGLF